MSFLDEEIASQPEVWRAAIAAASSAPLPGAGERVAVIGCGSSLNVARSYAWLRETAGQGLTDAYPASEFGAVRRDYDHAVLISRTGTTSEVLATLADLPGQMITTSVTADGSAPLAAGTRNTVLLDYANEQSVVSSRFVTAAIVLLRAHLGEDLSGLPASGEAALARPLAPELADRSEFTFLGRNWAAFVADEAALKLREASRSWSESYPAMEYRHGPISVSDENTVTWGIGDIPADLAADAARTGATVINDGGDPLAGLIGAQRLAVLLAARKGINPDHPRALSRSVILA